MPRGTIATAKVKTRRTRAILREDRQTSPVVRGVCAKLPRTPATNLFVRGGSEGGDRFTTSPA
jgi:hypothetical protein